jgi:hypothetical protein
VKWRHVKDGLPPEDEDRQALVFTPWYPVGNPMRYRLMGSRFVRVCEEVTHWIYVDELEPKTRRKHGPEA